MNVFLQKINASFNAKQRLTILALVIINLLLMTIIRLSHTESFGKVEGNGYKWEAYVLQRGKQARTLANYSKLADTEMDVVSIKYDHELNDIHQNSYLAIGTETPYTLRHNRAFYLDEQCSLVFIGRAGMTLKNVVLRCFY